MEWPIPQPGQLLKPTILNTHNEGLLKPEEMKKRIINADTQNNNSTRCFKNILTALI